MRPSPSILPSQLSRLVTVFSTVSHQFPRRNPSVSPQETTGFRRGNRWILLQKPQVSCVLCWSMHLPLGARKARKKWGKMHRVTDYHTSITLSVTTSVTNQTSYHPMNYVRLVTEWQIFSRKFFWYCLRGLLKRVWLYAESGELTIKTQ